MRQFDRSLPPPGPGVDLTVQPAMHSQVTVRQRSAQELAAQWNL